MVYILWAIASFLGLGFVFSSLEKRLISTRKSSGDRHGNWTRFIISQATWSADLGHGSAQVLCHYSPLS
jgi:hypothetical protein